MCSSRALLAVAFALLALPAAAGTTVIASRNVAGTFTSAAVIAPANLQSVAVSVTPDSADYLDAAKRITLLVDLSTDGGATWTVYLAADWDGGARVVKGVTNPPLTLGSPGLGLAGQRLRVRFVTPARVRLSAAIVVSP